MQVQSDHLYYTLTPATKYTCCTATLRTLNFDVTLVGILLHLFMSPLLLGRQGLVALCLGL